MSTYKTNIIENGFQGVANGVHIATSVVSQTMGPYGYNVAVEMDDFPFFGTTNDGATLIEKMDMEDPCEKIGLNALKEACSRSNMNSGDGSTTTCVIADAVLQESLASGLSGVNIKRELDALLPVVLEKIGERSRPITVSEVSSVATIASESADMGQLLGNIYTDIGKDGIIYVEGSGNEKTSYTTVKGVRYTRTGFLSPYMVSEGEKNKAIYENPIILVTKKKIEKDSDIEDIMDHVIKSGRPIVIFTDDMDTGVATRMIAMHRAKVAKICVVRAPVTWKNSVFEDFALCTGSTIVADETGVMFKNLDGSHLGTCDLIVIDNKEVQLIGTKDVSEHIADLKTHDDEESRLRVSWLVTNTAMVKLGSLSETDLYYKRLKLEDAIRSSQLALSGGVVDGGGLCLEAIADEIDNPILSKALRAPAKQLRMNGVTTVDTSVVVDAADIVKGAVKNALGVVSTLLTIHPVITKPQKSVEQLTLEALQQKGLRL